MRLFRSTKAGVATTLLLLASLFAPASLDARSVDSALEIEKKLKNGDIVVALTGQGDSKFVTGTILINDRPERVWQIVANPFEFCGKISPRMREVKMMLDKHDQSVMKVTMDVMIIPHFNYVVESHYKSNEKIEFHRVDGTLKDFKGSWEIVPKDNGTKCELTYSMFLDTGFFVPQWVIREGVKGELPRTLSAIKKRVDAVSSKREVLQAQTIAAVNATDSLAEKHPALF
jgi:ribosome-associated toxin RatA of RatAB toxin-antitoxin module